MSIQTLIDVLGYAVAGLGGAMVVITVQNLRATRKRAEQRARWSGNKSTRVCQVRSKDGQVDLYMPDGTLIPEQISMVLEQPLDDATNRPAHVYATIKVIASVADTGATDAITPRVVVAKYIFEE